MYAISLPEGGLGGVGLVNAAAGGDYNRGK